MDLWSAGHLNTAIACCQRPGQRTGADLNLHHPFITVAQEVFKDVVRSCKKKKITQLDLNLDTSVNDNKKDFYKYINGKRRGARKTSIPYCMQRGM